MFFTDTSTIGKNDLYPLINGLSDHDAQLQILNKGQKREKECHSYIKRKINKYTIADFQLKLSHETWEPVLDGNYVNKIFNSFLNVFLRIYYSSFPLIRGQGELAGPYRGHSVTVRRREWLEGGSSYSPEVVDVYYSLSLLKTVCGW
jgi:hypothetical protein